MRGKAKGAYKGKNVKYIESKYSSGDVWAACRVIKSVSSVTHINNKNESKPIRTEGINDSDLPTTFNKFYSRF